MPTSAFYAHLSALEAQGAAQGTAAAAPGVYRRPWQLPPAFPTGEDVQTPAALAAGCDRADLNAACLEAYRLGGRVGLIVPHKIAIDYQAAYERALQARHASAVRCRVWAGARRAGHGYAGLGVFGAVRRDLDARLASATAVSAGPAAESVIAAAGG